MDQQPPIPDIRPEVNKEPQESKRAGILAGLFAGGRSGAGLGAFTAPGGGLLATKAGLLALVLTGTTLAGGIGMVGYKLFGPGDSDQAGGNLSIFQPKPKEAASDPKAADVKDGNSASLDFFAKANSGALKEDAPAGAPNPSDAASAGAAASADAAASGAGSAHADASASKPMAGLGKKFGELSKNLGSGSVAIGGSAAPKSALDVSALASAAKSGQAGAMAGGRGSAATGGRSVAARNRSSGAIRQAMGVKGDNRGAASSAAGGKTYDGSAANTGGAIGDSNAIGTEGAGIGASQQKSMAATSSKDTNEYEAPPEPETEDVTPYENEIMTAQIIIGVAALLLVAASLLAKGHPLIAQVIGGVVAAMGAVVIGLGAEIAGSQYGQTLQGGILAAAGAGLVLAGTTAAMGNTLKDAKAAEAGTKAGMLGGINTFVLIGGGLALVGLAATMMMPPKSYPSTEFEDGKAPEGMFFSLNGLPPPRAPETSPA